MGLLRSVMAYSLMFLVRVTIMVALGCAFLGGIAAFVLVNDMKLFNLTAELDTIADWQPRDNTVIFDRDGAKIAEMFHEYRIFTPYEEIPKNLINAIVAVEDQDFWTHNGIDPRGIVRAIWINSRGGRHLSGQGASTITQQVVRHFLLPSEKTLARKLKEIFLAMQLEHRLGKERIIELYANSFFMGSGAYGVGAAAYRYFGKNLKNLDLHECALLAGLFQSPSMYNPHRFPKRAKQRQTHVLNAMIRAGFLGPRERDDWVKKPLSFKPYEAMYGRYAPYFVDYVEDEAKRILNIKTIKGKGLRIRTTLDATLQKIAEKAIHTHEGMLSKAESRVFPLPTDKMDTFQPRIEAAMLATDPRSGEILAMVGGRDYQISKYNRAAQAFRQPGSLFKPIVYSLALTSGFRWSDVIYVSPITLGENYRPRSSEDDYLTETTVLRAFYRSMNSPTLQIGTQLGIEPILTQAARLGVASPLKREYGVVLGASEVTMFDMARVYDTFANRGITPRLGAITEIRDNAGRILFKPKIEPQPARSISEQIAYLMVEGMRQVLERGTGRRASNLADQAVGKTGTTNDSADNWFNGFTPNLGCVVWVGTDNHNPIGEPASGGVLAVPLWDTFMQEAIALRPIEAFHAPENVVQVRVHPQLGYATAQGVPMWFLDTRLPEKGLAPVHTFQGSDSLRDPFPSTDRRKAD